MADGASAEVGRRFDVIFERHHRDVIRYCVRRLGAADAEDAAAEVFAVAWRRLDEVPDGDSTKAWLLAVAYRVVGNQYRGRSRRGRLVAKLSGVPRQDSARAEVLFGTDEMLPVVMALESLRSTDRELLKMVAWDELSRSEIAHVLGISENAVNQRLFKARARLRDRLGRPGAMATERIEA